jgi:hypothetical protein
MQYAFSWTTFPTAFVLALALSLPGQAQSANNEERPIRALIQDFADARNSHDGIAVASFYSDDGEWIAARGVRTVRGRAALVELWTGFLVKSCELSSLLTSRATTLPSCA